MLKAQTGKSHESLHIIVLAPYAWRHASRSAGSLLSTCLDDSNDTTIFRSGQTSINTRRKISRSRQTKTVLKNHQQIIHFSSKFNLLTDRHLKNWVIVNSALTLAYMIHGFMVLWPLKYLWYLVGSGVRKKQCSLQTPTKTKHHCWKCSSMNSTHTLYIHSFGITLATAGPTTGKATGYVVYASWGFFSFYV
jgi:hypothetical protein